MIFHLRTPFCPPLPAASSSVFICNFFECTYSVDVIPINQQRILVMVDRTDPAHVTVTDTAKVFFDILLALRRRRLPDRRRPLATCPEYHMLTSLHDPVNC